jgi:hypothetical protein
MVLIGPVWLTKGVTKWETYEGRARNRHVGGDLRTHRHAHRADTYSFHCTLDQADRPVTHRSTRYQNRHVDFSVDKDGGHGGTGHVDDRTGVRIEAHHPDVDRRCVP